MTSQTTKDKIRRLGNLPSKKHHKKRFVPLDDPKKTTLDFKLLSLLSKSPVPKNGVFSDFDEKHLDYAAKIYNYFITRFTTETDVDDILDDFFEAKRQLNDGLFQYIWEISMAQSKRVLPKTHILWKLIVPDITLRSPFQFFTASQTIQRSSPKDNEGSTVTDETKTITFETGTNVDPEHLVAWWREDPWWNSHHWHWHIINPVKGVVMVPGEKPVLRDRQGELFWYMHQQMVARYDIERMSAGLARVLPFKDFREEMHPYDAHLVDSSGAKNYSARPRGIKMPSVRPYLQYDLIENEIRRQRIYDAIDRGFFEKTVTVQTADGKSEVINKLFPIDIDVLGGTIEANGFSIEGEVNPQSFYGNLHGQGHQLIARAIDPDGSTNSSPGPMGNTATAIRDPMFWRWHKFVDDTVYRWLNKQAPYPFMKGVEDVDKPLIVKSFSALSVGGNNLERKPNEFYTIFEKREIILNYISPINNQYYDVVAHVRTVNYEPFNYNIQVENTSGSDKEIIVRIFLVPYLSEVNKKGIDRRLFVEMDRFFYTLPSGEHTITRSSELSTILQSPNIQESGLFDDANDDVSGDEQDYCFCGLPRHMLLPRGLKGKKGLPCKLFVMINDAINDKVKTGLNDKCGSVYCGVRNEKYPIKRTMGFPFDKPLGNKPPEGVDQAEWIINPDEKYLQILVERNPNTAVTNASIHWVPKNEANVVRNTTFKV